MKNCVTIDLEDYYQVSAFSRNIIVDQWDACLSRIEHSTAKLLSILDERGARATFFTLGWVVQKFPKLVREIACHSNIHRSVCDMDSHEFRMDTLRAKRRLEDVTGAQVHGYRAPSFSIKANSLWAYEILAELGFTYDSSIYPISHPNYGWPRAPRFPFTITTNSGSIVEFPMSTLQLGGLRAPIGGGAYFRLLPYWYTRWGLRHINNDEERFACIYLHPWELDPEQPQMQGTITARLRHYLGLRGAESKLRRLLIDFEVQPLNSFIAKLNSSESSECYLDGIPKIDLAELGSYLCAYH